MKHKRHSRWLTALLALLLSLVIASPAAAATSTLIYSGSTSYNRIALTFDLGSDAGGLPSILQTLADYRVQSTFFVTGSSAAAYPNAAKSILAGGNEIGNHSYDHPDFTTISTTRMIDELRRTESLLYQQTGRYPKPYFRPPYGAQNSLVLQTVGNTGYPYTIMWNIDTIDWQFPSTETIRNRVLNNAKNGAIVLMHVSGQTNTRFALPGIIQGLKDRGYELVTISEMLGLAGTFSDVPPGFWAYDAIESLYDQGIVKGYPNGTYKPNDNLSREHAAKMIVLGAGLNYAGKTAAFRDVSPYSEFSPYIAALADDGAVTGYPDGTFRPKASVNRAQLAKILVEAFDLTLGPKSVTFKDMPTDGSEVYIRILASNGIAGGYPDGTFDPYGLATRAQFAVILTAAMDVSQGY